ncbi:MAG: FAD-dependent thymidylate synthase [Geminicoccaceae bacterium]|nr:MAG: FAD-dependent thymidylate synthase [Geminicoccaceae bacterium]
MTLGEAEREAIRQQREMSTPTRRATVEALEAILFEPIEVLDHGFVRVVDYMGDDAAIVQAARVSYGKGTKSVSSDAGLINYLLRHRHTTPFEMCEIKLHVKLPIFVARQWIRHRTANVNEYSARYSILDREFYVPAADQVAPQSTSNRQGRGEPLDDAAAAAVRARMQASGAEAFDLYDALLAEDGPGLARELARGVLPLATYTQWYWKIDLHNLLHFTALRADPHAQYEIQAYGRVLLDIVEKWVPLTHRAFVEYRLEGASLSRTQLQVVRRLLRGEAVDFAASGLSQREWAELQQVLADRV